MMDSSLIYSLIYMLLIAVGAFLLFRGVISKNQFEMLKGLITVAVQGAEQIFGPGRGDEKKRYVLEKLKVYGIDINKIEIDMLIESAVLQMNTWMTQNRSALVQSETNPN